MIIYIYEGKTYRRDASIIQLLHLAVKGYIQVISSTNTHSILQRAARPGERVSRGPRPYGRY